MEYTDKQIKYIKRLRESGLDWSEVVDEYNDQYPEDIKTLNALRKVYKRYQDYDIDDDTIIKNLKAARQYAKTNTKLRKENKKILDNIITVEKFLEEFSSTFKKCGLKTYTLKKGIKDKKKTKMVIEAMISDMHMGLKTKSYNSNIAKDRMQKFTETFLREISRCAKNYQIEFLQILSLGDIIQSATMHKDSASSCHLTNAEQLAASIECLFYDLLLPIGLTGYKIKVIGLCGNHDREDNSNFTANPGIMYYTYTVYRALEMLCKQSRLKNIMFEIPEDPYLVYEIFGKYFLAEHGYLIKKGSIDAMENMLIKRSAQTQKILSGIRIGHYHTDLIGSKGRHIINGAPVSDDHFGNGLGYRSRPCQIINYYVETKKRSTSYYHSFPVNLE